MGDLDIEINRDAFIAERGSLTRRLVQEQLGALGDRGALLGA